MPTITLEKDSGTTTFQCESGDNLLDTLLDNGEKYPHGCRAGSCGACRTIIIEGGNQLPTPGTIEKITIEGILEKNNIPLPLDSHVRLACRVEVTNDIKIRALY